MIKRIALWGALCLLGISFKAEAQNYAIGTNLPYWLTGTINLQPSMALTQKVTLELGIQAKPIDFKLPLPTGLMDTFYSDRSLGADERFKIHNVYHTQHAFIQERTTGASSSGSTLLLATTSSVPIQEIPLTPRATSSVEGCPWAMPMSSRLAGISRASWAAPSSRRSMIATIGRASLRQRISSAHC